MNAKKIKIVLIGIAVVALVAIGFALASRFEASREVAPEEAGTAVSISTVREEDEDADAVSPLEDDSEAVNTIYYNGQSYMLNPDLSTLLIMGIDDYELEESSTYRNSSQADFLLLAIFDNENKTCTLLQLNRDTMCDVSVLGVMGDYIGLTTEQLALAHTYGSGLEDSGENTVSTVSRLLYGAPVDNYLSLTMGGVSILNDMVGGVTVTIEDDFTGVDDTLVQGETVTLMGEHALNYVRARFTMTDDATNITRMRRQRTYMSGLTEAIRAKVKENSTFVLELYAALADYIVTDCAVDELADYSSQLIDYALGDIVTPDGEAVKGDTYIEFYVDEDALQQTVIDLFYVPVNND